MRNEGNEVSPITLQGYEKDPELVANGARVSLGKNPDGSVRVIRVKPLNSAAYEDRLNARRKQYSRATLQSDPEIDARLQRDTVAEKVFVGFENFYSAGSFEQITGPDGLKVWKVREGVEPLSDDFPTRRAMIEDRDFYVQVLEAAGTMETFRKFQAESDLGNSQTSSGGS